MKQVCRQQTAAVLALAFKVFVNLLHQKFSVRCFCRPAWSSCREYIQLNNKEAALIVLNKSEDFSVYGRNYFLAFFQVCCQLSQSKKS